MALKVTEAVQRAIWTLIRANIAAGGHLARVAEGVADTLRPPTPPPAHGLPQRVFWGVDADGLPVRPWRVRGGDVVECAALGCDVPARICVARQKASDAQRTKDTWRGEASDYPRCVTERCAQGRGIREALDPDVGPTFRREGPGKRWVSRRRADRGPQMAARKRQQRVGLHDEVRTLDVDPDPVTPEGEE